MSFRWAHYDQLWQASPGHQSGIQGIFARPRWSVRNINQTIKALEISLHQPDVRSDTEKLKHLLHPKYTEIGYSGKTYNLQSILQALATEKASNAGTDIWSQSYSFTDLTPDIVQVYYLSAHNNNGTLSRYAKRTSIWVQDSASWKMQFHQATPTSPFAFLKKPDSW